MQPDYTICVTTIGALASQRAFAEYAVRELQQLYRNVICVIYDNNIVTLYGGAAPHGSGTPLSKSTMADRPFEFFWHPRHGVPVFPTALRTPPKPVPTTVRLCSQHVWLCSWAEISPPRSPT